MEEKFFWCETFSSALVKVKAGHKIRRSGWNGKGMWVGLTIPIDTNQLPYLYLTIASGHRVPWTISQTDVLATDWESTYSPPVTAEGKIGY